VNESLKALVKQEDTILFVGSGVSSWSGVPRWSGLIAELAQFFDSRGLDSSLIRAELSRNDLLQAASYAFDQLTAQQAGEFLRRACKVGSAKPHDIHRKLLNLGIRCFITTNYDQLIEQSLREWKSTQHFRVVTNRQLSETAEIIQARSTDFVFKPHGDIDDLQSIILTREQYRILLPGGERNSALETLRILLATRPVLYVGFGLRDPDFLLIRDLLANTYKGGIRDHFGIMADITEREADYWRRNYGIQLISYNTTRLLNGKEDHSALLKLLETLPPSDNKTPTDVPASLLSKDSLILPLMRHAARVSAGEVLSNEFPILVHLNAREQTFYSPDRFSGVRVEKFLDEGPHRAVLIGSPGAGKSYALLRSASRLSEKLHQNLLLSSLDENEILVPILVDLKLYEGDVYALVERSLPLGITLDRLISTFKTKLFLDAFNEMPRQFMESGDWEADFSRFLEKMENVSVILASRTKDGLEALRLPFYSLDELDERFVAKELVHHGIAITGRFEPELHSLFQTPLYFKLAITNQILVQAGMHPTDIYGQFIDGLLLEFDQRFNGALDLAHVLSKAAFDAIDSGQEALSMATITKIFSRQLQEEAASKFESAEFINWLISRNIFIPYSGGRVAFFHQSITEYLAAQDLAKRYLSNRAILNQKMAWRRWDHALFLTLGLLPQGAGDDFMDDVISSDIVLAFSAARFVTHNSDAVVTKLLAKLLQLRALKRNRELDHGIQRALESLPVSDVHTLALTELVKTGGSVGAGALLLLHHLRSLSPSDFINILLEHRNDYNFCSTVGREIGSILTISDLPALAKAVDQFQAYLAEGEEFKEAQGFTPGLAEMLLNIPIHDLRASLLNEVPTDTPIVSLELFLDTLRDYRSSEGLRVAGDLIAAGVYQAVVPFHFVAHFSEQTLDWSYINGEHVRACINVLEHPKFGPWALDCIQEICTHRKDLSSVVAQFAFNRPPIWRACLLWALGPEYLEEAFNALRELPGLEDLTRRTPAIRALAHAELNWLGREGQFVSLVRLRSVPLALALIESVYSSIQQKGPIGILEIGSIDWWLDWLNEGKRDTDLWLFEDRIAWLFNHHLTPDSRAQFVAEFNKRDSPYREVLARSILLAQTDLTTDDFSDDAQSFLVRSLSTQKSVDPVWGHLLGNSATEKFATDTLLPLLTTASGTLKRNLRAVLNVAGKRHGRRYIGR
jgi:hypothetical protein